MDPTITKPAPARRRGKTYSGGNGLLSPFCEEPLCIVAGDTAEELSRFGPRNAGDELDATGKGLVGHLVVRDVLGNDVFQLGLLLGVLCDKSGGLLLWDDKGEG